jgi:predicted Fe-Mo cluster-binding NifX family protein
MKRISFACDDNSGLQAQLSGHFGRCPYYTLVDVEGSEIKGVNVIENPYFNNHVPGEVPHFIKDQKANVMIAGGMGPRAIDLFSGFGIEVATGISGKVSDILSAYLSGKVSGTVACGHDHEESCGEGH